MIEKKKYKGNHRYCEYVTGYFLTRISVIQINLWFRLQESNWTTYKNMSSHYKCTTFNAKQI